MRALKSCESYAMLFAATRSQPNGASVGHFGLYQQIKGKVFFKSMMFNPPAELQRPFQGILCRGFHLSPIYVY